MTKVHIHNWVQNGVWRCISEDHCHQEPDILDANTVWHVMGIIKQHSLVILSSDKEVCLCGWSGESHFDHVDTVVLYWLREYNPAV